MWQARRTVRWTDEATKEIGALQNQVDIFCLSTGHGESRQQLKQLVVEYYVTIIVLRNTRFPSLGIWSDLISLAFRNWFVSQTISAGCPSNCWQSENCLSLAILKLVEPVRPVFTKLVKWNTSYGMTSVSERSETGRGAGRPGTR